MISVHTTTIEPTKSNQDQGQSLVEFALVVGLIVIVMLGSFEIFNLLQQKADLDKVILQVARQAGEFGGVSGSEGQDELEAYIRLQLENLGHSENNVTKALDTLDVEVYPWNASTETFETIPTGNTECQYGEFVRVSILVPWETSLPQVLFFNGFIKGGDFDLSATARCWRAL